MSRTAWSQLYQQELDFKQILKKRGLIASVDHEALGLTQEDRDWMKHDLLCPSCRAPGASVVRSDVAKSGKRNTRQAHFRFLNDAGRTAHKVGCDFYMLDEEPGFTRGFDVQFSANDRDTKIVRELVCKSIAIGALKKTDVFSMRQWFLAHRDANTFLVAGNDAMVDWLLSVFNIRIAPFAFKPFHASLPGFSVNKAAGQMMALHYQEFRAQLPKVRFDAATRDRAKRLISMHKGQPLIAMEPLRPQYEATRKFTSLMVELGSLNLSRKSRYNEDKTAPALLAFAATLLFVSDWDIEAALRKFAQIVAAPQPEDLTLGNVMGFNPFHDFAAIEIVRCISALQPDRAYDFAAELANIRASIEQAYSSQAL